MDNPLCVSIQQEINRRFLNLNDVTEIRTQLAQGRGVYTRASTQDLLDDLLGVTLTYEDARREELTQVRNQYRTQGCDRIKSAEPA